MANFGHVLKAQLRQLQADVEAEHRLEVSRLHAIIRGLREELLSQEKRTLQLQGGTGDGGAGNLTAESPPPVDMLEDTVDDVSSPGLKVLTTLGRLELEPIDASPKDECTGPPAVMRCMSAGSSPSSSSDEDVLSQRPKLLLHKRRKKQQPQSSLRQGVPPPSVASSFKDVLARSRSGSRSPSSAPGGSGSGGDDLEGGETRNKANCSTGAALALDSLPGQLGDTAHAGAIVASSGMGDSGARNGTAVAGPSLCDAAGHDDHAVGEGRPSMLAGASTASLSTVSRISSLQIPRGGEDHCHRSASIKVMAVSSFVNDMAHRRSARCSSKARDPALCDDDDYDGVCVAPPRSNSRRPSFNTNMVQEAGFDDEEEELSGHFVVLPKWQDSAWRKNQQHRVTQLVGAPGAGGLFGSRTESVLRERLGEVGDDEEDSEGDDDDMNCFARLRPWMISPSCAAHLVWSLAGLVLISYDIMVIPMHEAYELSPSEPVLVLMTWLVRLFWTLDMCVNFLTGELDGQGRVDMNPRRVMQRYLKTWFSFDICCVLVDWVILLFKFDFAIKLRRLPRLIRCLKLLRLAKAPVLEKMITERIRSEQVILWANIGKSMLLMLVSAHVVGCIWFAIGGWYDGWVKTFELDESALAVQYAWSLHWALAQFVGELVVEPVNAVERYFAICILFGAFLAATLFVSSTTNSLTRLQIISSDQSSKLAALRRYLCDHAISSSLAIRVQRNAQHVVTQQQHNVPESSIELLSLISGPLRAELHFEVLSPVLLAHPFFDAYSRFNSFGVREICHVAVHQQLLSKGDIVFSELESKAKPAMYFVKVGRLGYSTPSRAMVPPLPLGPKDWASEATLWTKWLHCGRLRSMGDSTLLVLDSEAFQKVISPFPSNHAQQYAAAFVEVLNSLDKNELTDLRLREEEEVLRWAFPDQEGRNVSGMATINRSGTKDLASGMSSMVRIAKSKTQGLLSS